MTDTEDHDAKDFTDETWLSLLGLVKPLEYFVTLDNMPIWRRHLAWAKTDGAELRQQVIQGFSSNMVFLSLMMGSSLMVLYTSSNADQMHEQIMNNNWWDLKFWVGLTIIISVCVTISALVATFTAWSMVSAISDANVHCVLRSSIGQYVCHLPSRLVVTSLYLNFLWILLSAMELTRGMVSVILLIAILTLFFQVVVTFSAFGRLIIHTGAMGKKTILEPALERALLPSGLHASLLIKATNHQRNRKTIISQYKSSPATVSNNNLEDSSGRSFGSAGSSVRESLRQYGSTRSVRTSHQSAKSTFVSRQSSTQMNDRSMGNVPSEATTDHKYFSRDTSALPLTNSIRETRTRPRTARKESLEFLAEEEDSTSESIDDLESSHSAEKRKSIGVDDLRSIHQAADSFESIADPRSSSSVAERRQSIALEDLKRIQRSAGSLGLTNSGASVLHMSNSSNARRKSLQVEWEEDADARGVYDADPPAELDSDDDDGDMEWGNTSVLMPRAALLNKTRHMESLRKLTSGEINSTGDKTIGGRTRSSRQSTLGKFMVPVTSFFKAVSLGPNPDDSYGTFGDEALDDFEEYSSESDHLLSSSNSSRKGSASSVVPPNSDQP